MVSDPMTWRDLAWILWAVTVGWVVSLLVVILMLAVATLFFWWFGTPQLMALRSRVDLFFLTRGSRERLEERVATLTRSRAEAVDHSAAELRRLERDLHDGTQARLVAVSMSLGLAEAQFDSDPDTARRTVTEAREATSAAIADLRSVVRGIHPPVLADRGLDGAVRALALDMAVPVEVTGTLPGRPPLPIESALYFAVAECLANSAKHAGHRHAWVELSHEKNLLRVGGRRRRARRRGRRQGHRDAGGHAAVGGVRRHDVGVQPRWRAHPGHPGGAVRPERLVLAEDNALLRVGLTQLLEASGFVVAREAVNAVELDAALEDPDVDGAVLDVRMPPTFTDEGLRAAIAVRARRPGVPGAGALAVRRAALRPRAAGQRRGRRRLPAQGPGLRRAPVRRRRAPGARRWHGARPRGRGGGDGPAARPSRWTG